MRKTILTILVTSAVAAVTAQAAVASERHHTRMSDRTAATGQFRQSNAYVPVEPDYSHYNAGMSAPAGR